MDKIMTHDEKIDIIVKVCKSQIDMIYTTLKTIGQLDESAQVLILVQSGKNLGINLTTDKNAKASGPIAGVMKALDELLPEGKRDQNGQ